MIQDIGLPELYYGGKANLWVEDAITRIYLSECWVDDAEIRFFTAGGNEHVQAILKDAEARGYSNVLGVIDRDFRTSNQPDWGNPAKGFRCFVLTVHELENYLLDVPALAGCVNNTGHRTAAEIQQRLEKRASELVWWMACRMVISTIRDDFHGDFLTHPTCAAVTDMASAEQAIVQQAWIQQLGPKTQTVTTAGEITQRLNSAYQIVQQQRIDGSWQQEFSGKELFRHVRGWLHTQPPAVVSPSELDIDLARAVAKYQVDHGTVPAEITQLRIAVREKAGL